MLRSARRARLEARARPMEIRIAAIVFALIAGAAPALAADPAPSDAPSLLAAPPRAAAPRNADADDVEYRHCMQLATQDPASARNMATAWQGRGGGHPAEHCFAVALIGLKQYRDAATRLESLAQAMVHAPAG